MPFAVHVPAVPALHCALAEHRHCDCWHENPCGHARPQAPQLVAVTARSKHPAGVWQQVCPVPQAASPLHEHASVVWCTQTSPSLHWTALHTHAPVPLLQVPAALPTLHSALAEQPQLPLADCVGLHTKGWVDGPWSVQALLQLPHDAAFAPTLVSQPSSAVGAAGSLQLPKPRAQVESHAPSWQSSEATFAALHARPHAPQLKTSVATFASQPVATFMSQSPNPAAHASVHAPATHDGVALTVLHALPHAPQSATFADRSTSQPFCAMPSQFA